MVFGQREISIFFFWKFLKLNDIYFVYYKSDIPKIIVQNLEENIFFVFLICICFWL